MKRFVKISLLLGLVFLTFVVGLGMGLGLGLLRPEARMVSRIDPLVRVERPFVEEIVIEEIQDEIIRAEELSGDIIRGSERGRLVWGDAPVITLPDIPPPPAPPANVVFHRGPSFLSWFGSLINALAAALLILIGVWLIVRKNRPPLEKTPEV